MNANRIIGLMSALLAAASICIGSSAYGQVVIAKGAPLETIMQNGLTTINLVPGNNAIDVPATFKCKSAKGCVVILAASLLANPSGDDAFYACSFIDGATPAPGCGGQGFYFYTDIVREQATVAAGTHTVDTIVNDVGNFGSQITGWETDYTIYEIK